MERFRFSKMLSTRRRWLALALLLLVAALPSLAQDNEEEDYLQYSFLNMSDSGLITFDDLENVTTYLKICERSSDDEDWEWVCPVYVGVEEASYQITDFILWKSYLVYMHGRLQGEEVQFDLVSGIARSFPPYDDPEPEPTPVPVVLTAPANLAIAENGVVTWDAVADAVKYGIDWRKNSESWNRDNESTPTSFSIPGFDDAASYRVEVWAIAGDDSTGPVSRATWLPPGAPANLAIGADGEVTWDAVSKADHYLLDWQKNQDSWNRDNQVSTTSFSIPNFDAVADYRVELRAVAADSAKGPAATATRFPPEAPSNLQISDSGSVTWDAVTDADHYLVNWLKGDGDWGSDNKVTSNSFQLPGFDAGASYGALVRAVAADGAESPAVLVTRTPPGSPQNLVINENGEVSWKSVDEASHYIVDWRLIDGTWNENNQVDAQALALGEPVAADEDDQVDAQAQDAPAAQADDTETFEIPGFDPTQNYETRVYAVNEDNVRSHPPAVTRFEAVQPTRATNLRISSSGYVSWSAATDASWYHTGWRLADGSWTTNTREEGTGFQIPDFDPANSYDASVQAIIVIGENAIAGEVVFAYWRPRSAGGGGEAFDAGATVVSIQPANCIAPHDGSTLIVCITHGWVHAQDYGLGISLYTVAACSDALPASNSALHIDCDNAGNIVVTQLNPQHPQDRRRDLLVFDPAVTTCYRAYEYLDTGAIEVWDRGCG